MFSILYIILFRVILEPNFSLIESINNKADFYQTDHQNNIYSISKGKVNKFNSNGEKLFSYSNAYLGNISQLDASNPLQILVFYKEFNQLLFLDNYLAQIGSPIVLDNLNHYQVSASCSSIKGGFWIFDDLEKKLYYYNNNLKLIHESISLSGFTNNLAPNCIIERNKMVFLLIPNLGLIICDEYGGYIKTLSFQNISSFQVHNKDIIYYSENALYFSSFTTAKISQITIPKVNNINNVRIENDLLYVFSTNGFNIYKIDKLDFLF